MTDTNSQKRKGNFQILKVSHSSGNLAQWSEQGWGTAHCKQTVSLGFIVSEEFASEEH